MDIFLLIGAPHILQSDNGQEFTASVITELKELWPDLVLVHGKPRHPQSQGSVERLNCDVKDMLIAWLHDNNSNDWAVGLKFVQFMKNSSHHSAINQTPYKAMFGCEPRVGLRSTNIPVEVLENMISEEDLNDFRAQCQSNEALPSESVQSMTSPSEESQSSSGSNQAASGASQSADGIRQSHVASSSSTSAENQSASDSSQTTSGSSQSNYGPSPSTAVASQSSYASQSTFHASQTTSQSADEVTPSTSAAGEITSEADGQSSNRDELVDSDSDGESNHQLSTSQSIQRSRKEAREGILKQAQRMIKRSRLENVPGKVGDNITIPIPLVDRGRGDPRNIVGVIVDRDENDLYKISVKGGILNGKYSRNQFDLCNYALLTTNDVSQDNEISLREAVQCESNCGGQGFLRCNCAGTSRCQTNRCKCFKAKMKCNSRCHSALTCNNKN